MSKRPLIGAGCLILSLFFSAEWAWANKAYGTFRVVKGSVQVKSHKDGKTSPARIGGKILPKDTIITGPDSRAKVVMVDNNEINVSPDSQMVFEEYEFDPEKDKKNVLLNVIYGKVRSKVNQKYDEQSNQFRVKTNSAVAGVRGTDFFTSYNSSTRATEVVTFKGEVALGTMGPNGAILNPVSVIPGQIASIMPGQAPQPPQAVPNDRLAEMEKTSDAEVAQSAPANAPEPREPAAEGASDKEKPQSDKAPAAPGTTAPRAPSSLAPTPGSGMMRAGDLPQSGAAPIVVPELANSPVLPPPTFQMPDGLRNCDFCRENVEGGNRRLLLKVINN